MLDIARKLSTSCANKDWLALIVGGYVRDHVLGLESKDLDMEFYGPEVMELHDFLLSFGKVQAVGSAFGVFKLRIDGVDIDCSLPRTESKIQPGHKGIKVVSDGNLSPMEAATRRDLTMNALSMHPVTGEIFDFFGGLNDMTQKRLVPVSGSFREDPLRVLRVFSQASIFDMVPVPTLSEYGQELKDEYETLPPDRIWTEWEKWATRSTRPSRGLKYLLTSGWIDFYPELRNLVGCVQEPEWHPEGDVWAHTLQALDSIIFSDNVKKEDRITVMFGTLLHDIGKPATLTFSEGRWRTKAHDKAGQTATETFLARIGAPNWVTDAVLPLVKCHMRRGGRKAIRRLANDLAPSTMWHWGMVCHADLAGTGDGMPSDKVDEMMKEAIVMTLADKAPKPILMGRHLIPLGYEPGPGMGQILDAAFEAQLEGAFSTVEEGLAWLDFDAQQEAEHAREV